MNNYEYIIASLPTFNDTERSSQGLDADGAIEEIRELLDEGDRSTLDFFLQSYDCDKLTEDFYRRALGARNDFVRDYCLFDLMVRNAKVAHLNKALRREEGKDTVEIGQGDDFVEKEQVETILGTQDILQREKGLDALMWEKVSELTVLKTFKLDNILGAVAKMKIIDRWLKLDADAGRELFRKFVEEIKNSKTI